MTDLKVASVIVDAAAQRLPLSVALRAASAEAPASRRRLLWAIGERLDAGESIEAALATQGSSVPAYLQELLRGAARTPDASAFLTQYVEQVRQSSDRRRRMRIDLTTPAILVLSTAALLLFLLCWVVPQFGKIFADFGTRLPLLTQWTCDLSDFVKANLRLILLLAFVGLGVLSFIVVGGRRSAALRSLLWSLPLVGPALRYSAYADFCEFLSLFVEFRVPLPEAVLFASQAADDVALQDPCARLASWMRSGVPPERAAAGVESFPPSLKHAFRYATDPASFHAALRAQAAVFNSVAESQSVTVPLVVGPVAMVGTASFALVAAYVLYAPLVSLLNDLS